MRAIDLFELIKWPLKSVAEFPLDLLNPAEMDRCRPIIYVKSLGPVLPLLDNDYTTISPSLTKDSINKAAERILKVIHRDGKCLDAGPDSPPKKIRNRSVSSVVDIDGDTYTFIHKNDVFILVEFDDDSYGLACLDSRNIFSSCSHRKKVY